MVYARVAVHAAKFPSLSTWIEAPAPWQLVTPRAGMERLPEMTSKVTTLARAAGMEDPGRVADVATQRPDPEVPERARWRTFTAKYKLEVLAAYDAAPDGEKGAVQLDEVGFLVRAEFGFLAAEPTFGFRNGHSFSGAGPGEVGLKFGGPRSLFGNCSARCGA